MFQLEAVGSLPITDRKFQNLQSLGAVYLNFHPDALIGEALVRQGTISKDFVEDNTVSPNVRLFKIISQGVRQAISVTLEENL